MVKEKWQNRGGESLDDSSYLLSLLSSSSISAMWPESLSLTSERDLSVIFFVSWRSSRKADLALEALSWKGRIRNLISH